MKRLFTLIALLAFTVSTLAQIGTPVKYFGSKKVTQDTTIDLSLSSNCNWSIGGNWTANSGTSALELQTTVDGTHYFTYYGISAISVTGATGEFMFEDSFVAGSKLRIKITIADASTYYLNLWVNYKKY
jgi:hypothetical protein